MEKVTRKNSVIRRFLRRHNLLKKTFVPDYRKSRLRIARTVGDYPEHFNDIYQNLVEFKNNH